MENHETMQKVKIQTGRSKMFKILGIVCLVVAPIMFLFGVFLTLGGQTDRWIYLFSGLIGFSAWWYLKLSKKYLKK